MTLSSSTRRATSSSRQYQSSSSRPPSSSSYSRSPSASSRSSLTIAHTTPHSEQQHRSRLTRSRPTSSSTIQQSSSTSRRKPSDPRQSQHHRQQQQQLQHQHTAIHVRNVSREQSPSNGSRHRLPGCIETGSDNGSERTMHSSYSGSDRGSRSARKTVESPVCKHKSDQTSSSYNSKATKKVIEELNRASNERRIAAITTACAEFDHTEEARHNHELRYGAAAILSKKLSMTDDDDEIRMICAAIEMVFRGSAKYVHVAFDKVGPTMIPLLLRLLDRCEGGTMKHADVSILNITKTLLYLSRIPELRVSMARQQGMLDAMRRVATSILNPDCRIARTRIIANLANCEENKVLIFEHEGLVDSILRIGHLDLSETAREYASYTLMDLASAPSNQVSLAKNVKLLGTLVKMVLFEKVAATRESAITALQNLAFTKENRSLLVDFKGGIVLEALRKALNSDKNDKARRRAAGALTNLACMDTAGRMGNHRGLLDTLAIVSTKDDNDDVQMRASLALTKIASNVTNKMECHEVLLDALVVASLSNCANSVSAVMRVKARDAENRETMASHPGILDTLADICISPGSSLKDKENAMRAIMHLTNENANRKAMCNKTILEALVQGASADSKDTEGIRDSAIRAIERLATEFSNRPLMARHEGLLVAVAKATEREAKLEETGTRVEQVFLAKPLLMSLLVAM